MSTDRDREGEKLVISGGAWRSGIKPEEEKNRLITELCDALTRVRPHLAQPDLELIQRAREATK
jgi:hypothetical protein